MVRICGLTEGQQKSEDLLLLGSVQMIIKGDFARSETIVFPSGEARVLLPRLRCWMRHKHKGLLQLLLCRPAVEWWVSEVGTKPHAADSSSPP